MFQYCHYYDTNRVIRGLSNGAIVNDLDGPRTQISRLGHSLTLTISKMAADTAIVTIITNMKPYPSFQMVSLSMTFSDL